ncbi:hypothetical protein [Actinomadura rugatobispora]|uniref:Tat (Twin-arginine translocation) pathway signal sequence n=1 Tax=Actinomadura rugatobispora TaxID=1994 RepID=A0ABW0ZRT7_9ACTN|nr:hypothetical protein GCM10010200_024370 [Actinomadura rugatobispora]
MLAVLAVALAAAFVAAPRMLAGDFAGSRDLVEALRESFTGYWSSGDRDLSPDLERVVDYWFRYHLAKAAIAAVLLVVLVALGTLVWKAFLKADGRGKRAALASAGVLVTMLAVSSLLATMANIQGAAAPYASLLPMLTAGAEPTGTLDQVRQQLAGYPGAGGHTPPALEVMISDFARYHVAMAVIAAIVAAFLIAVSTMLWIRFARTEPSAKRVLGSFGVLSALLSLAMIVIAVANTATAADPAPALLAFFEGSW